MRKFRIGRRCPYPSGAVLPGISLHGRLCSDYPEISARAISDAIDRALLLGSSTHTVADRPCGVEQHARTALETLRARCGAATARTGIPRPRSEATPEQIRS